MQPKVRIRAKQQPILTQDLRLEVPVLLAESVMAVLNFLERYGSVFEDIGELTNEVKPRLEAVLRTK